MSYNGQQYSTTNPLSNGHWKLVSASDGDTALVYHEKTYSRWGISTADIASDAFWVWNQGTHNTLVFEFDFGSVITPTADPTSDPTFTPTNDPTAIPTFKPMNDPTAIPTFKPTNDPTFK